MRYIAGIKHGDERYDFDFWVVKSCREVELSENHLSFKLVRRR